MATQPIDYERVTGPATLVFADTLVRREALTRLVAAAGGRPAAAQTPRMMPGILDAWAGTAVVVLDAGAHETPWLAALLDRIEHGVAGARFECVLIAGRDLIDVVIARIRDPRVALLIDPDDRTIADEIAALLAARVPALAEPASDEEARTLARLGEETARIARALTALSGDAAAGAEEAVADPQAALTMTRTMLRLRRLRDRYFERALFADPAWDMLLDLFAARLERRRVAVSSLCIAAAVPPTTALRWIAALTAQGLIERRPDPRDGRRVFIALTPAAAAAMGRYMAAALHHVRPAASGAAPGL